MEKTFLGLGEWLERRTQLTPEKIGLVDVESGTRLSYRALNERARALAVLLSEDYGVGPGERVAVLAYNAPEYLDALFAVALLGAILVPLNWRLTIPELLTIMRDCEPRLLLHDEEHSQRASELVEALTSTAGSAGPAPRLLSWAAFPGEDQQLAARAHPFRSTDGEEPVLILYTSGTTGVPKGAMLSHRMITWNAINTQISWGLRDDDITPTFAPFFHAGGLNVLTTPLYHCGGTVVLLRSSDPALILHTIEAERCTVVFAVPTVFQLMLEHPAFATTDLSSLRFCVTGGSSCPLPVIRGYGERGVLLRQGYGLTEVGVNCFSLAPEDALRKAGSVGRPVFHSRARIVDEHDQDVAPGEVGELVLAGPHVCSGYWRRPAETAEATRGGWWHTGDLARCDEEGYYYIVGRKKDLFISGGENVYPAEVEAVLLSHPGVAEAAVIGRPDPRWGEVGLAIVVPRAPGSLRSEELLAFCGERLARYKIPKQIVFAEALPRNAMGKVLKAELRARYVQEGEQ
ncbi:MAG: long-chain fatty acid--CoA ligase [Thermogemmatispora sp.]|jgi:fatty-acyl-CoA synthase|uniref:acyl-CoA synthetase n=1 Tax=Thermogemmatispora sp. TaxID=1968838 RepID=UPI001A0CBC6A|nr:long-chain fatty acid--CoA ligase [Thermogemmatispora sp.]MBE3566276.1 long-chain fatty acid--CoA ligase [Thermogemmatispora sp.]